MNVTYLTTALSPSPRTCALAQREELDCQIDVVSVAEADGVASGGRLLRQAPLLDFQVVLRPLQCDVLGSQARGPLRASKCARRALPRT